MNKVFKPLIRTSAFITKEIKDVIRQPRLLFTLVLGPFLIMLVFGVGYRNQPRELRTLFVVQDGSNLTENIEEFASSLGPQLIYAGTRQDLGQALSQLSKGKVDLVAQAPERAFQTIRNDQQAVFTLYHHEIDPMQVSYVQYFGRIYVDEVNRRVLTKVTQEGQSEASTLEQDIKSARESASLMKTALQEGNITQAQQSQERLSNNLDEISLALGASLGVLNGVQETVGDGDNEYTQSLESYLSEIRTTSDELNEYSELSTASDSDIEKVSEMEARLADLETQLDQFSNISPGILVSPFAIQTKTIAPTQPGQVDYFAPAVIALLLQHMAVTFSALSIVRESNIGAIELFQASPASAGETLMGKYLSYFIFSALIAAALTALLVLGLGVPMLGNWLHFSLVVGAVIFTSLGIGFLISLLSQTDSQAVQLTMLVLLASVFFSGFILKLELIWGPVRAFSWILPTTYGITMLRDISFLGQSLNGLALAGLISIGIFLMLLSLLLLRRKVNKG